MSKPQPLVSIIIPVYNTEKYLRHCLDSITNQSYTNIEIIIIDDGSTDNSPHICDEYAQQYKNVSVYHRKNQGVSSARNFGIETATGSYIIFIDSDDYIATTMCQELISAALSYNSDIVICGNYNVSTVGSTIRSIFPNTTYFSGELFTQEICIATLGLTRKKLSNPAKLDRLTPIWARLYKTDIIRSNNIHFIDLQKLPSECLQFNYEYCIHAKSGVYIDIPLYYYRRNTLMSVTKPYRSNLWNKWNWWIEYMISFLNEQKLNDQHWEAFYSRICCSIIPLGGNALKSKEKIKETKSFLQKDIFKIAFQHFDTAQMPFYWKTFFSSAKNKRIYIFLGLTWLMRKILMLRKS